MPCECDISANVADELHLISSMTPHVQVQDIVSFTIGGDLKLTQN